MSTCTYKQVNGKCSRFNIRPTTKTKTDKKGICLHKSYENEKACEEYSFKLMVSKSIR